MLPEATHEPTAAAADRELPRRVVLDHAGPSRALHPRGRMLNKLLVQATSRLISRIIKGRHNVQRDRPNKQIINKTDKQITMQQNGTNEKKKYIHTQTFPQFNRRCVSCGGRETEVAKAECKFVTDEPNPTSPTRVISKLRLVAGLSFHSTISRNPPMAYLRFSKLIYIK